MEEGKKRKEERKDEGKESKQRKKGWGNKKEGTGMKGRRGEERFHLRKHSHYNMDGLGACHDIPWLNWSDLQVVEGPGDLSG